MAGRAALDGRVACGILAGILAPALATFLSGLFAWSDRYWIGATMNLIAFLLAGLISGLIAGRQAALAVGLGMGLSFGLVSLVLLARSVLGTGPVRSPLLLLLFSFGTFLGARRANLFPVNTSTVLSKAT